MKRKKIRITCILVSLCLFSVCKSEAVNGKELAKDVSSQKEMLVEKAEGQVPLSRFIRNTKKEEEWKTYKSTYIRLSLGSLNSKEEGYIGKKGILKVGNTSMQLQVNSLDRTKKEEIYLYLFPKGG